ncbi:hypothetical protein PEX1_097830 [Penicillium expansum]|uniref:IEC3 subunit of the Ino80 complex, chromatin re-modelling-domain-containing protein n=1 Tax=Penicillium expansum TaxID=27334 RepID=A0A0A2JZ63_PENEN|nr:hypothetical protein PEX2_019390 [Penicillium expansum]KGO37338.1 hypothetical protein PEXP_003460 [Penicillium expansum]KGO57495.1 hypothetical protein PEX2_019390 [Penicillium expansum]KGO65189.1 hypothetical protein PEX1_097830 [Penicillium expansum]
MAEPNDNRVTESLLSAPTSAPAPAKQSVRSFKKKYAKLKVRFELGTRENESLIREELRIEDLSKRIQEQNDQLLEVLMEFNESLHVSPDVRFDLSMPNDPPLLPTPEQEIIPLINDATLAKQAWKEAKAGLAAGSIDTGAYRAIEDNIKRNKAFAPAQQYSSLSQTHHISPDTVEKKPENDCERKLGYFTPEHETEYYLALDAKLGDEAAATQLARIPDRPTFAERERDLSMRNPASVYNWLRRNQPQTLQDNEIASEKSASRPSNQRSSKRAPAQRKDEDMYDEDGAEAHPTPKNKRKREEDTGYRPKGGSSRSKKKKEEPTSNPSKVAKKP